jgi:hypothetical protein
MTFIVARAGSQHGTNFARQRRIDIGPMESRRRGGVSGGGSFLPATESPHG